MKFISVTVLLVFLSTFAFAASWVKTYIIYISKDTLLNSDLLDQIDYSPDTLYARGVEEVQKGEFEVARDYFAEAANGFKGSRRWSDYVLSMNFMVRVNFGLYNFKDQDKILEDNLRIVCSRLDSSKNLLGSIYRSLGVYQMYYNGRYDSASYYFDNAIFFLNSIENPDSVIYSESLYYSGQSDFYRGNIHSAQKKLFKVIEYYKKLNNRYLGDAYNVLGNSYWALGQHDSALVNYEYSREFNIREWGPYSIQVAWNNNNMGYVYKARSQHHVARSYFNRARLIREKILDRSHPELADSYSNLGMINSHLEEYQEAIKFNLKALTILKENLGSAHPNLATVYLNIILPLAKEKRFSEAQLYFQKAREILEKNPSKKFGEISNLYMNVGFLYYEMGKPDSLKWAFNNAIRAIEDSYDLKDRLSITYINYAKLLLIEGNYEDALEKLNYVTDSIAEGLEMVYFPQVLLEALDEKNRAYLLALSQNKLYKSQENLAILNIKKGQRLINSVLRESRSRNDRYELSNAIHKFYSGAVSFYGELYNRNHEDSLLINIFQYIQSSKGLTSRFVNSERMAKIMTSIPDSLIHKESELLDEINALFTKYQQLPDSADFMIHKLREEHRNLISHLEENYPKYYRIKYSTNFLNLTDAMKELQDGQLALDFMSAEESLYCMAYTNEDVKFRKVEISRDSLGILSSRFLGHIEDYQNMKDTYWREYDELSSILSQIVFGMDFKIERYQKIIVLIDGPLEKVPIELLKVNSGENNMSFLVTELPVVYGYSSDQFLKKTTHARFKVWETGFVAFAPSVFNTAIADSLSFNPFRDLELELKWSKHEIERLREVLDGKIVTGKEATETAFKRLSNARIIHVASHAFFDSDNPLYSKLVFSKSDSLNDGYLYAQELYDMNLTAGLAVLSACNTGKTELIRGEGGIGLSNAFMYAGVPSVVMSKWQVDDQSTSQLMQYFYKNLKSGITKSEALRQAKLEFLETAPPEKQHPFYWGAFVVIGDDSPLFTRSYLWV
ncbi:MAG: CHAT domain-containing tetratricopeptide repeat protein, partial [Bacteroidota bacterium]